MIDMSAMLDRLSNWAQFTRQYWSLDLVPHPTVLALMAVLGGFVLAMWGARLLRAVYVVGFMVAGAALGIRIARQLEVDVLIGLVLGGGVAGLVGHLLYRWWVGLTAGVCAALAVALVGAPWTLGQAEAFADALLRQATGEQLFAIPAGSDATQVVASAPADRAWPAVDWSAVVASSQSVDDQTARLPVGVMVETWARTLWQTVPAESKDLGLLAGIAALLGLALGVILPRLTTVIGTSVFGVLAVAAGVASLLAAYVPNVWRFCQSKPGWAYGILGLLLVVSLAFQARRGRLRQVAPAAAAAPAVP
jgi:hypothetical protein